VHIVKKKRAERPKERITNGRIRMPTLVLLERCLKFHDTVADDEALNGKLSLVRYHELVSRIQDVKSNKSNNDDIPSFTAIRWFSMMRRVLKSNNARMRVTDGKDKLFVRAMRAFMMRGLEHPHVELIASRFESKLDNQYKISLSSDSAEERVRKRVRVQSRWVLLPILPVFSYYHLLKRRAFCHKHLTVVASYSNADSEQRLQYSTGEYLDRYMPSVTLSRSRLQRVPDLILRRHTWEYVDDKFKRMVYMSSIVLSRYNIPSCLRKMFLMRIFYGDEDDEDTSYKSLMEGEHINGMYSMRTKKREYKSLRSTFELLELKEAAETRAIARDREISRRLNLESVHTVSQLEELTIDQMKVLCRLRKVKGYSKFRRNELVMHIAKELRLEGMNAAIQEVLRASGEEEEQAPNVTALSQYTCKQLRSKLTDGRIYYRSGMKKAQLIHLCSQYNIS